MSEIVTMPDGLLRQQLKYTNSIKRKLTGFTQAEIDLETPNSLTGLTLSKPQIVSKYVSYLIEEVTVGLFLPNYQIKKPIVATIEFFNGDKYSQFIRPISGMSLESNEIIYQAQYFLDFKLQSANKLSIPVDPDYNFFGKLKLTNLCEEDIIEVDVIISGLSRSNL